MWKQIHNQIFFPIRRRLPSFRSKAYSESLEYPIEQDLIPVEVAKRMSLAILKDCLFYAWVLEQAFHDQPVFRDSQKFEIVDIGSKNFFYAPALYFHFKKHFKQVKLLGLEADTSRMYTNLYRRGDYARYYVSLLNEYEGHPVADYQEGNWLSFKRTDIQSFKRTDIKSFKQTNHQTLERDQKFNLVTCFFPFLFTDLNDNWGLPRRYFDPEALLRKCLTEGDYFMVWNQGQEEAEEAKKIISKICGKNPVLEKVFQENPYVRRKHPIHFLLYTSFCINPKN